MSKKISLEKLKERYPKRVAASSKKEYLALVLGLLFCVIGFGGAGLELLGAAVAPSSADFGPNPIGIVMGIGMGVLGIQAIRMSRRFNDPKGQTPFVLECQEIFDEIQSNGYAVKKDAEYAKCEMYTLDELFEIYRSIDRNHLKVRFGTISYLILEKLS